eukprot:gene3958-7892_t
MINYVQLVHSFHTRTAFILSVSLLKVGKVRAISLNSSMNLSAHGSINVLGGHLESCCYSPMTGFYRDGFCETGPADTGRHTVCSKITEEFLVFTKSRGNDLSTPYPAFGFPGLKPGDKWCLCAGRWAEAETAGSAPPIYLRSTNIKALEVIPLETMQKYAVEDDASVQSCLGETTTMTHAGDNHDNVNQDHNHNDISKRS